MKGVITLPVFNFQITGNESSMLCVAFPVEHDIYLNHEIRDEDVRGKHEAFHKFYRFDAPVSKVVRTALDYVGTRAIKPETFDRKLDKADKGTDESNNWPSPFCKYAVRLSDEHNKLLEHLAGKYFHSNKTYAMVWVLRNFSAQLARDNTLMSSTRHPSRLSDTNSGKVNVRLPNDVLRYYDSMRNGKSLGKMIREAVLRDFERMTSTTTETLSDDVIDLTEFE